MTKLAISIVVPNYNHAKFLEQRLESILNQTYQNFEVILLDDASTDGSIKLLEKYEDRPKVSHFIVNNVNSGSPFKQWIKGIELAQGDYIWIAESDDFCDLNFLMSLMPMFQENTALVYCSSKLVNEKGTVLGLDPWSEGKINSRWTKSFHASGPDEINNYLRFINVIPNASAVIFKKSIIEKIKFPTHMLYCGDWDIYIKVLANGDLGYLNRPLNYFRTHTNTTRSTKDWEGEKKRFQEYFYMITMKSSICSRFKNRHKLRWIINELWLKKNYYSLKFIFSLNPPIDLHFQIYHKYLLFHFTTVKSHIKNLLRNIKKVVWR